MSGKPDVEKVKKHLAALHQLDLLIAESRMVEAFLDRATPAGDYLLQFKRCFVYINENRAQCTGFAGNWFSLTESRACRELTYLNLNAQCALIELMRRNKTNYINSITLEFEGLFHCIDNSLAYLWVNPNQNQPLEVL